MREELEGGLLVRGMEGRREETEREGKGIPPSERVVTIWNNLEWNITDWQF